MAKEMTYDSRCWDLAEVFLQDEPGLNTEVAKHQLACEIQDTIENEITFMRYRRLEATAQEVLNASDEEIMKRAKEQNIDVDALQERIKAMIAEKSVQAQTVNKE